MFMRAKIRLFSEYSKTQNSKLAYTIACTPNVLSTAVATATISFSIVLQVSLFIFFMVFCIWYYYRLFLCFIVVDVALSPRPLSCSIP